MAEALARRGHDVQVVTYHLGDATTSLPFTVHRIRNVSRYTNAAPGPTWGKLLHLDFLLVGTLQRVLRSQDFDVIHAHHYEGLLTALLSGHRPRLPIVYDAHTLLASELPYYRMALPRAAKAAIGRALDRWLPSRADRVIAVTDDIRATLIAAARVKADRIALIPNGVESEHFSAAAPRQQPSPRHVTFAGNLAAYQGIDLLLKAFALVREQCGDVRLHLLTDSDFAAYVPLAEALGIRASIDVSNPDYMALPAHLQSAEVLLNPRPACDGIPQKLLNYMAAGRPIVSFAGSAKLIEHGRTGLVVNDGDVGAFAEATLDLLARPELGRELGANAQHLVVTQYGWHQVAAKVEAVYVDVLAERRRVSPALPT
jgi:glycosyltransferase involved in cell wall biosynthesis